MKRIIRLTESDLARIVRRVISEQKQSPKECDPSTVKEINVSDFEVIKLKQEQGILTWKEVVDGFKVKFYSCKTKERAQKEKEGAFHNKMLNRLSGPQ
jgi:glucan biosynthesis protein